MKRISVLLLLSLVCLPLYAPPNCELYKNDADCYEACQAAMKAIRFRQGSYYSQQYFDQSIELCQSFAYSYQEKAVPFLKRGAFIEWKRLIDKAVEYAPREYLGYRGWCRLQFLRDYEGAIQDIERLRSMTIHDIGYCQTGDYHLNVALALCYKATGEIEKAQLLIEEQLNNKNVPVGLYDYYHLGVMEYEQGNYEKAIQSLQSQIAVNDYMGETYYFLAMIYREQGQEEVALQNLKKAEQYYRQGRFRSDTYTEPMDKIYLLDILEAM